MNHILVKKKNQNINSFLYKSLIVSFKVIHDYYLLIIIMMHHLNTNQCRSFDITIKLYLNNIILKLFY